MGGGSNPISDVLNTVTKAVDDTFKEVDRVASGDGVHLDPFVKQKQKMKDAAKQDKANRAKALEAQKTREDNLRKQKLSNAEASKGSTIILGGKGRKKGSGSSVSSGLGLSKGKTGLQG